MTNSYCTFVKIPMSSCRYNRLATGSIPGAWGGDFSSLLHVQTGPGSSQPPIK